MKQSLLNQKIRKRGFFNPLFLRKTAKSLPGISGSPLKRLAGFWLFHRAKLLAASVFLVFALGGGSLLLIPHPDQKDFKAEQTPVSQAQSPLAATIIDAEETLENGSLAADSGSGLRLPQRLYDQSLTIERGQTISEIAYQYGVQQWWLAAFNKLANPHVIKAGQEIIIPSDVTLASFKKEYGQKRLEEYKAKVLHIPQTGTLPRRIRVATVSRQKRANGGVTASFKLLTSIAADPVSYVWNLGNGLRSYKKSPSVAYTTPGTYVITLTLVDKQGYKTRSNSLIVDVPYPDTIKSDDKEFIVLGSTDEVFELSGNILGVQTDETNPVVTVGKEGDHYRYQVREPGYYHLVTQDGNEKKDVYLFASPVASKHNDRQDINWYRTQFHTSTLSNCGPSMVSMAIGWARGEYVPVAKIRQEIGWTHKDGSTSFNDLIKALSRHKIGFEFKSIGSMADLFQILDKGNIIGVLFQTGLISTARMPEHNLFGRHYKDDYGHYILIKGYSLNKEYFIVYDPTPSDWQSNSKRYGDGLSMLGRNRYYAAKELFNALKEDKVLEIQR